MFQLNGKPASTLEAEAAVRRMVEPVLVEAINDGSGVLVFDDLDFVEVRGERQDVSAWVRSLRS